MSNLAPSRPPSASRNSHNLGLQLHLHTESIMASKCISKLCCSWPRSVSLSSLNPGLHLHQQTRLITPAECISEFTPCLPPSASPNSLDHGLQVHLPVHSISASKCISGLTRLRPPSTSLSSDGGCTDIHEWWWWNEWPRVFSSHLVIQRKYTLYLSQLLVRVALAEILWILMAGWYHIFSPSSCAPWARTALPHKFSVDVARGVAESSWWALCLLAMSIHHNGLHMVHLQVLSMGLSRFSFNYAWLPSVVRLTICIYIEILK